MNKRSMRSVIALIMAVAFVVLCFSSSVFAEEEKAAAGITVSASAVSVQPGQSAEIEISVSGDAAVRSLGLIIEYDESALTITNEDAAAGNTKLYPGLFSCNAEKGVLRAAWVNSEPIEQKGVLLKLKFTAGDAEGSYPIVIKVDQAFTNDPDTVGKYNPVLTECKNGSVEIKKAEILYGDVYVDGVVNGKDLQLFRQYFAGWDVVLGNESAADVYTDGEINGKDLQLFRQYFAGWDVTIGK